MSTTVARNSSKRAEPMALSWRLATSTSRSLLYWAGSMAEASVHGETELIDGRTCSWEASTLRFDCDRSAARSTAVRGTQRTFLPFSSYDGVSVVSISPTTTSSPITVRVSLAGHRRCGSSPVVVVATSPSRTTRGVSFSRPRVSVTSAAASRLSQCSRSPRSLPMSVSHGLSQCTANPQSRCTWRRACCRHKRTTSTVSTHGSLRS